MRKIGLLLLLTAAIMTTQTTPASAKTSRPDLTTHYAVYQKDHLLKEFAQEKDAVSYAKHYTHSYVQSLASGAWLWTNFPRYRIYRYNSTVPQWEFSTLQAAEKEAKKYDHTSIRDLQGYGWVWSNYPNYQVYQGDTTKLTWEFTSLDDAIHTAKALSGSHIIRLSDNHWVWDNLSEVQRYPASDSPPHDQYQVEQNNKPVKDQIYPSLYKAVEAALKLDNSEVINRSTHALAYSNMKQYTVYADGKAMHSYVNLLKAIHQAETLKQARVKLANREIWNNVPYYHVMKDGKMVGAYDTPMQAHKAALIIAHSEIVTADGQLIWKQYHPIDVLGWNGTGNSHSILSQISDVQGLSMDSPTWFTLADSHGKVSDTSDMYTALALRRNGLKLYPLVSNDFNYARTKYFLERPKAQEAFIHQVVDKVHFLGGDGINIDFESVPGADRSAFSTFVENFCSYAHKYGLKVGIDLPRGSVDWNSKTAFDHEMLKNYVDQIIIMTYDEHWSGSSSAGSVAGLQWTENGIQQFLSYGVPRHKLFLGIPLYIRQWKMDANGKLLKERAYTMKDVPNLIQGKKIKKIWDPINGQYIIKYQENGYTYELWLEDSSSIETRIDLAKRYKLGGLAVWRLGYEDKTDWNHLISLF